MLAACRRAVLARCGALAARTVSAASQSAESVAAGPAVTGSRIAAAGDIACDPDSSSFSNGRRQRARVSAAGDLGSPRRRRVRGRARARRHPVRGRRVREVPRVVRPVVGTREVDHEAGAREPRVPDGRRRRLLPVLRRGSRRSGEGLLQLRPRRLARRRAELELRRRRRLRRRLAAGAVAPRRPRRHPATCTLAYWHHPRFSSGDARQRLDVHGVLAGARTRRTRTSCSSVTTTTTSASRPQDATAGSIRAAGSASSSSARAARNLRRFPRLRAEQRGARRDEPRRARAHARARRRTRGASGRRSAVHGQRLRPLPLSAQRGPGTPLNS